MEIPQSLKPKAKLVGGNSVQPPPAPPIPLDRVVAKQESYPPMVAREHTSEETVSSCSVKVYTIAALQQLTNSFSPEHVVGEDDLGRVYLAELPDGKV